MTPSDRPALRDALRARRRALDARTRLAAGEAVAARLRGQLSGYVAGYWAVDGELPLHALLAGPSDFVYCLPVLIAGRQLRFAPWRAGDPLAANRFGIPEPTLHPASRLAPAALDAVLVPLVGFARSGARLGSGGGYYDRSFALLNSSLRPAKPRLIGIGYACQECPELIAEPWDVALDAVVTEHEWIDCRTTPQL